MYYWNELEQKLESKPSIIVKDNNVTLPSNSLTKNAVEVMNANTTACVVEAWHSGTSWYRVWSDGWIEQGGSVTGTPNWVGLHKSFTSTSYCAYLCVVSAFGGDGDASFDPYINTNNKQLNGFSVGYAQRNAFGRYTFNWMAVGY